MLNEQSNERVLFSGYAKLPVGITAAEMYKVIGVIVVVDMKSGLIVKADCTLATELARQYIAQCLIGYNLSNGHEELQNILERQYQGSAKKAVATAMRIIYDKYRSFKNGESAEGSDKFIEDNKITKMYKKIPSTKMLKGFFHITGLVSASACSKMKAGEG